MQLLRRLDVSEPIAILLLKFGRLKRTTALYIMITKKVVKCSPTIDK